MTPNVQTLTQRFAAGRMPWNDALRYGLQIIDSLRHAHEEGSCHGALTPDAVSFSATGVELTRPQSGDGPRVTPYTAPECLSGNAPDARSDIFSMGALLYEMFTGRRAFNGDTPEELAASLEHSTPEPIGDTGLDRLVLNCLVKDPAGRWQRVQQVHMEFRILTFSSKRAQQLSVPRRDFVVQSALRQVETQLSARLDQQFGEAAAGLRHLSEKLPLLETEMAARLEQQAAETTAALRHMSAELPLMESHLASRLAERHGEAMAALHHLSAELPLVESRLLSRVEQQERALAQVQSVISGLPEREAQLAVRIEQQESRLADARQALAELPELESRLAARMERHESVLASVPQLETRLTTSIEQQESLLSSVAELESRLSSRIEQQEGALASAQQTLGGLPEWMEKHEGVLAGVPELESRLTARIEQQEDALASAQQAVAGLSDLESRLTSRVEPKAALVASLQQVAEEQRAVLETISQSVSDIQDQVLSLESKFVTEHGSIQHAEQAASQFAEMQGELINEMRELGATVKEHAAAIESIRTSMARTDDFMERVVEALESLQNMVLEQARDRAIA